MVSDKSSLYSLLALKVFICSFRSHKSPVEVSSTRGGEFSMWVSMIDRIESSASDRLRKCWRSSEERGKHLDGYASFGAYLAFGCRRHFPTWRGRLGRPVSLHHSAGHHEALRASIDIQDNTRG